MATRELGLGGRSSSFGERGITKRLGALESLTALRGDHLLDIGCGNGDYTLRLAGGFDEVDAVDVEPLRLADFRAALADRPELTHVRVHEMAAERLAFDDATFDVVTTIEVLEHVSDLDRTASEVARVLRPGGRFLVTSPNKWFPFETHGVLWPGGRRRPPYSAPFLPWVPPLHRRMADARTFTVRGLSSTLAAHGLRRTAATYIMPPLDKLPGARYLRPVVDTVERSPLRALGMALVVVYRKDR